MCINGPRVAHLVTSSEKLSNVIYVFYYQLSDTGNIEMVQGTCISLPEFCVALTPRELPPPLARNIHTASSTQKSHSMQ